MGKKMTLRKSLAIILSVFLLVALSLAAVGTLSAHAEELSYSGHFVGISGNMNLQDLYDKTNTYKYSPNSYKLNHVYHSDGDYYTYHMNDEEREERNTNDYINYRKHAYYKVSSETETGIEVIDGSPQITVLTHGLGGYATHWSNNNDPKNTQFTYDDESLFGVLASKLNSGADVYWAKMDEDDNEKFYLINMKDNLTDTYDDTKINNIPLKPFKECTTKRYIESASKHIIVLFETSDNGALNNYIYEQFNYVVSKIVYDVKCFNNGKLPRLNLIGHSRGGLINLIYALDHPDLVDSMFSLGTPYLGSDMGVTSLGALFCGNAEVL